MKRLSTILFALAISLTAFAQAPEGVNYQAVARDAGGDVLVSENLTVRMTIKESGPAGTTVYQETHSATTNDFGLFSLTVGQGSVVSGTFSTIDWGSASHFLQVEVDDGSGYVNLGTTQFVSVPYALYAKEAGNAGTSYNAGTGIDISGNTISNTAPDQTVTLTGSGATTISGTYPNFTINSTDDNTTYSAGTGLNLSGTTFHAMNTNAMWNANQLQGNVVSANSPNSGEVLKWNGSAWAPANDVGGGAGDDWGSQVVQSDATLTGDGTSGNDLGIAQQGASSGEVLKWNGSTWAPATDATGGGGSSPWQTSGSDIYYNNGNVGIGTNSPSDGLTLHASDNSNDLRIENTFPFIELNTTSGNNAGILFENQGGDDGYIMHNAGADAIFISGANSPTAVPNLAVTSSGDVGIGTATPDNQFTVSGDANVTGDLGINETNPSAPLHITLTGTALDDGIQLRSSQGTNEDWYFYMPSSENLVIRDDSDDVLTIENGSGALGVGTTDPTQDLEVADVDGSGDAILKVGDASGSRVQIGTIEYIEDVGGHELEINATIFPDIDNLEDLGTSSLRYNDVYAANGVTTTSDKSAKEDIHPMQYGLDEVMALKPMRYKTKNAHHPVDQYSIGLIAQDVLPVISEVVKTHDWVRTEDGAFKKVKLDRLGINYGALTPILIKSIQEQQHQIEELEENNIQLQEQIEALQNENEEFDKRLSDLESQ